MCIAFFLGSLHFQGLVTPGRKAVHLHLEVGGSQPSEAMAFADQPKPRHLRFFCQRRWQLSPDTVTFDAGASRNPQSPTLCQHHWQRHCHASALQIGRTWESSSSLLVSEHDPLMFGQIINF